MLYGISKDENIKLLEINRLILSIIQFKDEKELDKKQFLSYKSEISKAIKDENLKTKEDTINKGINLFNRLIDKGVCERESKEVIRLLLDYKKFLSNIKNINENNNKFEN